MAVFLLYNRNLHFLLYKKNSSRMRTRANKNYAVSGHAQCENAVNDGMISAKCIWRRKNKHFLYKISRKCKFVL